MAVSELIRTARGIEALENFARADGPLEPGSAAHGEDDEGAGDGRGNGIHSDDFFWATVAGWFPRRDGDPGPDDPFAEWWEQPFSFMVAAVSEWVARVPGLHSSPGAAALRASARRGLEAVSNGWHAYTPEAKTALVLGGTGTLKLPPNEQGYHLVSLSVGHNASTGIPALVAPEVWEHPRFGRAGGPRHMAEGDVLYDVTARWRKMSLGWAERFESIKGIPRGYLVLDRPECIGHVGERGTPVHFHPCTVMEYESGDALLWDFVFCSVDTQVAGLRRRVEEFFADYCRAGGRDGRYLFPADVADPWWDAEFASPAELRASRAGRTQLELMKERVYRQTYGGRTLDALIRALAERSTVDEMREFAATLDLGAGIVAGRMTPGEAAAALVHAAARRKEEGKVEALLDALLARTPRAFEG